MQKVSDLYNAILQKVCNSTARTVCMIINDTHVRDTQKERETWKKRETESERLIGDDL